MNNAQRKKLIPKIFLVLLCLIAAALFAQHLHKQGKPAALVFCGAIWIVLAYYLCIIIHEAGHLVTGLLSGYEFLSFRIGSAAWVKTDNGIERKKLELAGSGGQCIMMPPETDTPENNPFLLYFAGGGLFNLLTALICLPLAACIKNSYAAQPFLITGLISLYLAIFNLVPMNLQLPNDGYNMMMFRRSREQRITLYQNLRVNGLLYRGLTLSEMPETLFTIGDGTGFGDMIHASLLIEQHDFPAAEALLEAAAQSGRLPGYYENECMCEILFCKIMNRAPEDEIRSVYGKTLQDFIAGAEKTQISKRRLMYAYYLIFKRNPEAAQKEYHTAQAMKHTYPSAGELKSEYALIEYIRQCGTAETA